MSVVPLAVILGAGASFASAGYGNADPLRPPLTIDLFDEQRYRRVVAAYDLAHQAGRFITDSLAEDDTLALEQALHDLRTSDHAHHRHMAVAVPLYLQDLLHQVSVAHYVDAFRYDRLIERLLRLPYVYFMTLNYDLLLDRRLNSHRLLSSFEDYVSGDKNWALIKLHGSVNWFHPAEPFDPYLPPADLRWGATTFECVAPNASLDAIRGSPVGTHVDRYPALALPEGPQDRLVLPRPHMDFLQRSLDAVQELDVLVIGYSGLDQEVLSLLHRAEVRIRRMTVVGRNQRDAATVYTRFRDAGLGANWPEVHVGDFGTWADRGGLTRLVAEYGGPYND